MEAAKGRGHVESGRGPSRGGGVGRGRGSGWDGGWVEGGLCPSPVSYSDTSFITGRKEAISVVVGGWIGGCSCTRVWPSLPPSPSCMLWEPETRGRAAGGLSAPAGRGHPLKCSQACTCHAWMYMLYIPHTPGQTHVNIPTHADTHLWQTSAYTLPLQDAAGSPPPPRNPHAPMVNSSKVMAVALWPRALLTLIETLYLTVENRCM